MAISYVALGSNLGDRRGHLDHALERCASLGEVTAGSPIYETDPVGGPKGQDAYLNAVLELSTELSPRELFNGLARIEEDRGRTRDVRWGPRTLDLDLLWYDDIVMRDPDLSIPHPGIRARPFVLAPLTDLAPAVGDELGPFSDSYPAAGAPGISRISGPVHPDGSRWMVGFADAIQLAGEGTQRSCVAHPDWANTSEDAFGAFLVGVALEAVRGVAPGTSPSHFTYRYLRAVPAGVQLEVDIVIDRQSQRSMDCTVSLAAGGTLYGRCTVGVLTHPPTPREGPGAPSILRRSECVQAHRLVAATGRTVGMSLRSWDPLERWDLPDLIDGTEQVVRAWSPNVVFGGNDPYLHAASIVMPIDALIWPATLQKVGGLPTEGVLSTPTVELTARFADISREAWLRCEATIDHLTDKSVSGSVRVWGADGTYSAIGHSLNLVRR